MNIAIGIDTGGTYTDAIIYDFNEKKVLSSAKALTTREDLSIGILNALDGLDNKYFPRADMVSLSTTLATNACVENKGGRAKLLFWGIDRRAFDMVGKNYGLTNLSDIVFYDKDDKEVKIDEASLIANTKEWLGDADGLGIVECFAMNNGAAYEKKSKEIFEKNYDFPVICGHELFSELNSIQRGSTTLLNAKLVPIIKEFISAIKHSLKERDINAPIVIVRSDSSLMSEEYSKLRPVETILSGPAASILGGMKLSDEKESIIIDMGGTTTDVSLVKNGYPERENNGISIGKWRTFVNGVFIDTFGLGGDSRITIKDGEIILGEKRVIPLCVAAKSWPYMIEELRELADTGKGHTYPLHEFLCLVKDIKNPENYTQDELKLCGMLKDGPLMLEKAAVAMDKDIYSFTAARLEEEGIIMRSGLTPTDIMHIKGDFDKFEVKASMQAAIFAANCLKRKNFKLSVDEFAERVYDTIKCKLYCNIVRILLCDKYPRFASEGLSPQMESIIKDSWELAKNSDTQYTDFDFKTNATLISIGAPTHIFINDVAKALGTKAVIPEFAGVANAVGAVFGGVRAHSTVEIRTEHSDVGFDGYRVYGKTKNYFTDEFDKAREFAIKEAKEDAIAEAKRRGASGNINIDILCDMKTGILKGDFEMELGASVTVIATAEI